MATKQVDGLARAEAMTDAEPELVPDEETAFQKELREMRQQMAGLVRRNPARQRQAWAPIGDG